MSKGDKTVLKDFDYEKMFELCKAYARLGERKQSIIEYLFTLDYFKGNYSDLTKAIGRPKNHAMDIRKECLLLEKMGLICIVYPEKYRDFYDEDGNMTKSNIRPEALFLVDGWYDTLIRWNKDQTQQSWSLNNKKVQESVRKKVI